MTRSTITATVLLTIPQQQPVTLPHLLLHLELLLLLYALYIQKEEAPFSCYIVGKIHSFVFSYIHSLIGIYIFSLINSLVYRYVWTYLVWEKLPMSVVQETCVSAMYAAVHVGCFDKIYVSVGSC